MYSNVSWNNPKRGVMAPNKGPSGFAIAWDQALQWWKKAKKKLLTRGKCARQESGEGKGWQPSFPLFSQLCGSLCSPVFIFFAVSLCFFASFPYYDDWSQAISATSTRFCCTMVPISLLVYWSTTLKKGKFWGGETWLLCSILTKMDTRIQHKIRIFLPSKVKDFYLFYFFSKGEGA